MIDLGKLAAIMRQALSGVFAPTDSVQRATSPEALAGTGDGVMTPPLTHAAFNQYGLGVQELPIFAGDADTLNVTGYTRASPSTTNIPLSVAAVIHTAASTTTAAVQTFYALSSGRTFQRQRTTSSGWSQWEEVWTSSTQLALGTTPASARTALELGAGARASYATGEQALEGEVGEGVYMSPYRTHQAFNQYGLGAVASEVPGGDIGVTDNSILPGFYRITTSTVGAPFGWGTLIHLRRGPGGGETQLAISDSESNRMLFRSRAGGAWSAWREVTHSDSTVVPAGVQAALNTKADSLVPVVTTSDSLTINATHQNSILAVITSSGNREVWIHNNSVIPLPIGFAVTIFKTVQAGQIRVGGQSGVVVQCPGIPSKTGDTEALYLRAQHSIVTAVKRQENVWMLFGAGIEES